MITDTAKSEVSPAPVSTKARLARLARRVLPNRTIRLAHVDPGLTLAVDLRRNLMFWTQGLAAFEPESVAVLRSLIRPGDTVLDVGANVGFYTVLAGRWVGQGGRVIAFEPDPINLRLLRRNIDENGLTNVQVRAAAAGPKTETSRFSIDQATGATGRIGEGLTQGESTVGTGRVEVVPIECVAVDDVVKELGLKPHVIKLDIEGYESEAIRGAGRVLAESRPAVVSELNGAGGTEVLQTFLDLDYTIWDVESGRIVEPGDERPFMIAALPRESASGELGRRLVASLPRPRV